jgi:capsular polysaccharide biosynthesis protein
LTNGGQPVLPSVAPWPIHIGNQVKKSHVDCHLIKRPWTSINISFDSDKRENKTLESAINLTTKKENHYGHWFLDHLPKLYYLSEYEKITNKKPKIIVNPNAPKWMIDSIRCMGFSRDRIISQNNKTFSVTNMIVPIHNRQLSPVPFRWLRSRAVEHVSSSKSSKRVFLSRQGVTDETQSYGNRKIQNFEEFKNVLVDLSFEIIRPEELSFKKQVDIISNADIIMGVYGSALHNLIFSSDTKIIEILHQDHPFYANYVLSLISDNEYIGIKTTPGIENADYELNHIRNQPLYVSPSQIKKQIQRV